MSGRHSAFSEFVVQNDFGFWRQLRPVQPKAQQFFVRLSSVFVC
jgi:hypothetical protein